MRSTFCFIKFMLNFIFIPMMLVRMIFICLLSYDITHIYELLVFVIYGHRLPYDCYELFWLELAYF